MTSITKRGVALIGVASDAGGRIPGAAQGPRILRERGIAEIIRHAGADLLDKGDVGMSSELSAWERPAFSEAEAQTRNHEAVFKVCAELYRKVEESLQEERVPLILGGDHSLSMGSVSAVSNYYRSRGERIGLIWIDTHPDINTPATSPSGNLHGLSVAALTGIMPGAFAMLGGKVPAVMPEHLAYIGLREVDPGEQHYIKQHQISSYTMKDVDRYGIAYCVERAIEIASKNTKGFVVSFDVDVCDPAIAPGTGTTKRGGLTFRESHLILEMLHDTGRALAFELVEFSPALDRDHVTADLTLSLVESAVGKTIL